MRRCKFRTEVNGPWFEGYFHAWSTEGSTEGGVYPVAVVENVVGNVYSVYVQLVIFTESPND